MVFSVFLFFSIPYELWKRVYATCGALPELFLVILVCLNAEISVIIAARDSKFGRQVALDLSTLKYISNLDCHAHCS